MQPTVSPESLGLGTRRLECMTRNHLAGDLAETGLETLDETTNRGAGFGLGFAVGQGPARAAVLAGAGECHWGAAASSALSSARR